MMMFVFQGLSSSPGLTLSQYGLEKPSIGTFSPCILKSVKCFPLFHSQLMTHLLDEPVNLILHIQYTITRVSDHLLTYMCFFFVGFVLFTTSNAVADSTAPFFENRVAQANGLNAVHY